MSLRTKLDGLRQIWQFDNRYGLILARLFLPNRQVAAYKYKGLEFVTDRSAGDANGAREILTTDTYRQFLPKMDLLRSIHVLDIGANNGGFSLLLMSEGFHLAQLACVEMNPKTFARMKDNIERNINGEFYAVNAAVCGENKLLDIRLGEGSVGDNIYRNSDGDACRIEGRTFDDIYTEAFADASVDLCKIDIEGAEFEMFRSGTVQKLKNCRYVLMEIHHEKDRNQDRQEIIQMLEKMGFHEMDGAKKMDAFHHVHLFVSQKEP